MEIIRYAELKAQPWRNGGGVTRVLASHPAAAAAGDAAAQPGWDWRVSIAEVSKAGGFSAFPGMDRVLTVIDGELLLLSVDGVEHPLEKYRPFRFSGDADSAGALPTGDVRDLNVFTRNGAFKGYTSIVELSKKRAHPVFAGQWGILLQGQATAGPGTAGASLSPDGEATAGEATSAAPREPEPAVVGLNRYDAVVGSDIATPEILGRGFLAVVSIDRVDGGAESLPVTD
jgi:environmental stress-induced protein Ves